MSSTLPPSLPPEAIEAELLAQFAPFGDNWEAKYEHLMRLGRQLPAAAEGLHDPQFLVRGCQSQVWLKASGAEGRLQLQADSDALIVKGLVAVLLQLYHNQPFSVALALEPLTLFETLGLSQHLSMTRRNGLGAMLKQIKLYALVLQQTQG
jgi:cysteine desulfuration protein SufE